MTPERWTCPLGGDRDAGNVPARCRLFCFPPAGGVAMRFARWRDRLGRGIELHGIQLPGRGPRLHEPAVGEWSVLVAQVGTALRGELDRPFCFLGHSFGAVLAFEVSRWLRRHCGVVPAHLFVSGRRAPRVPSPTQRHLLPDREFLADIASLGGTSPEVLANPEILSMALPALRADVRLSELYRYTPESPLSCPISVLSGSADADNRGAAVERWREETAAASTLHVFPGGHFFIDTCEEAVLSHVRSVLERL